MNDPQRLLSGDATPVEQLLLRSADEDEPPADGAAKLAAALGVSAALAATSAAASVASELSAAGSSSQLASWKLVLGKLAFKHVAIGASGLALASTVALSALPEARSPEPSRRTESAQPAPRPRAPEVARPVQPEQPEPQPPTSALTSSPRGGRSASIAREIARIDAVRGALAQGEAALALELLEAYDIAHQKGALREEASLLRIEALSHAGRSDEARRATLSFLRAYPHSVHGPRLRAALRELRDAG